MENGKHIQKDENNDGIDRAGFLKCMAWAGTGVLWMMSGGIMKSFGMSQMIDKSTGGLKKGLIIPKSDFSFVQISDSHIGFNKAANTDVVGTLQAAIAKINASRAKKSSRRVTEWGGSALSARTESAPRESSDGYGVHSCLQIPRRQRDQIFPS